MSERDRQPERPLDRPRERGDARPGVGRAGQDGTGGAVPGGRFLTVAEVAAMMRVSKMTVYRMVHSGELGAVRVGRSFRVPEKAVHEYLQRAYIEAG